MVAPGTGSDAPSTTTPVSVSPASTTRSSPVDAPGTATSSGSGSTWPSTLRRWLPGERSPTLNLPSRQVVVHLGGAAAPPRPPRTQDPARGASGSAGGTGPARGGAAG